VPGISQTPDGDVVIVDTGSMLRVEKKSHCARVSAEADVAVAVAMAACVTASRRGTAIDERAILVDCVV
jgi:hypothetical protein